MKIIYNKDPKISVFIFLSNLKHYEECAASFHLFYVDLINLFLHEVTQIDNGSLNKKPSKRVGKTCGNTLLLNNNKIKKGL